MRHVMSRAASYQSQCGSSAARLPALLLLAVSGVLLGLSQTTGAARTADESPHWNKSACSECHADPAPTDSSDVSSDNYSDLCIDCHGETSASSCPHPTNLATGSPGEQALPESYRLALEDDRIVCTTCHAVQQQCTGGRREQYQNPAFLRNGPSRDGQVCFDCHASEHFTRLNPHDTVPGGEHEGCLFCHDSVPGNGEATYSGLRLSANQQCTGCHTSVPHPLSAPGASSDEWTHLVVPDADTAARMRAAEDSTGISLPLDPDSGAINCATCHNVHAPDSPGYLPRTAVAAPSKLRRFDICDACHDK